MIRHREEPRAGWQARVEQSGFSYHTPNGVMYWDESASYVFSNEQIAVLEKASNQLHRMCLKAVDHVIRENLFDSFFIPAAYIPLIKASWQRETPSIYGRFDLSWNGDLSQPPKLFEYNADTPTSLLEASVIQWFWLQDTYPEADQFNSIHDKLIAWWKHIRSWMKEERLHFSCLDEFPEDYMNMSYLQDCAMQAGLKTAFVPVTEIGWNGKAFTDREEQAIDTLFKLYPWEWIMHEEFGAYLPKANTIWIEPPWKMILSNKQILPLLWKLFPDHPLLLECYFGDAGGMLHYIRKPVLAREGANVQLVEDGKVILETPGEYGEEGYVYQQLHTLPNFDGNYPVIGSWIIGGKSAGIGIRESKGPVTDNFSRFVPHRIL
jgi:glutathionylspermidine synthase